MSLAGDSGQCGFNQKILDGFEFETNLENMSSVETYAAMLHVL